MNNNQNNKIMYGIGGIVIGLILGALFAPMMRSGGMMSWNDNQNPSVRSGMTSAIDQHFIEQMIPHHDGAIAMANLALEKAIRPEIKTLAQAILKAQTAENQEMRAWYQDWFGKSVPTGMNPGMGGMMSQGGMHMGSTQDIDALKNATDFDKEFIEQMIPHHDGAIAMASLALEKATRPEIKTLAQAILKAQTAENQEMRAWYQDWFRKSVPTGTNLGMGGMMSQGGMHMGSTQDTDALKNAADFDKAFIEQMIPHHQMAIMMARMLEAGTNRPEMQQLAKNIIKSQSEEIQQMQGWYTNWYK